MEMVKLTIDGIQVEVPAGTTVLDAARKININIPTLCYLKGVNAISSCRICMVDAGARTLSAACTLPATEGMNVKTSTPEVRMARKTNLELLLSNHDKRCLACVRSQDCELQKLCKDLGVEDEGAYAGESNHYELDEVSESIVRDPNKCILCRRCVATCQTIQKVGVIGATQRGFKTIVEPAWDLALADTACINCGQCINACPVGALREKDDIEKVWTALADPTKHVVVQPAPAVRAALGEEFGMPMGTRVTGKMTAALHRLGFDKVFDTDFGADMTILEEASELISRIKNNGVLPMMTSCSPGWIKFCEHYYPDFLDNLSSCKSPHMMLGATIKSFYAEHNGIDPKDIVTVSVMPCTAKKYEAARPEMVNAEGLRDIDIVITTRELARMLKQANVDFVNLPDEEFDDLLGESTGAAALFGVTGGVMEAALRTAYDVLTGEELEAVDFHDVRGIGGVKEASIKIGDMDVNVAVASGTANAARLLDSIRAGKKQYHFIEIMACPGGCVNGGGQPIVPADVRAKLDPRVERAKALYTEDKKKVYRKSHENVQLKHVYEAYFGEPNGERSHNLLHTHYYKRDKYPRKEKAAE